MAKWATEKERKTLLDGIRARDGNLACHWCGAGPRKSIDHVVSRSNGGSDDLWNLVASCVDCNSRRGNDDDARHCDFCESAHRRTGGV